MALCHDCISIKDETQSDLINYSGPSVDEVCLLEMAYNCRLLYFWDKDSQYLRYKKNEVIYSATLIRTFKFTAERKAMSVIVELEGKTYVYLKGADSYVLPKCKFQAEGSQ